MTVLGITYDIFRNGALGLASVSENPRWIAALLRPTVSPAFSECRTVLSREDGGVVDIEALAREIDMPPSPDTWAQLVSNPSLDAEIERHVASNFEAMTHVIGFGLPPTLMRLLDRLEISFLDIEIAQVRFSSKLRFRARTNSLSFRDTLLSLRHPLSEHIIEAQRALSEKARRERLSGLRRGVFVGQTQLDLALVENGRLKQPHDNDLIEKFQALVADLDEVHVLTHPSSASRLGHIIPLVERVEKTVLGASSTYAMLSHSETVRVIGLSSGALVEAQTLGIEACGLISPDRDNPRFLPKNLSEWIEVDDALFSSETISAFAQDRSNGEAKLIGAHLVEAGLGINQRTLANAEAIRDLPRLKADFVYSLGSDGGRTEFGVLQFGWSDPEAWGVWSIGQVAALAFRTSTTVACRMTIRGIYFKHQAAQYKFQPEINVSISIDGKRASATLAPDDDGWLISADLPGGLGDALVAVHFFIAGACSPSTFAINSDRRKLGVGLVDVKIARPETPRATSEQTQDAKYYRAAHTDLEGYRDNNWMMPFAKPLLSLKVDTVVECACGNGEFSEIFSRRVSNYWAMDWAASPLLPHSTPGFHHVRWDAYSDTLPQADLLLSADFLEHLREESLDNVLGRMLMAAPRQFHVIACYDDFHSHLTIESPDWWLHRLRTVAASQGRNANNWKLLDWAHRNPERPVAIVCNFANEIAGDR